ncbi:MAG: RagB/SusD family nutrient uptake outer membrane protein [Ginsengibacter sp.]
MKKILYAVVIILFIGGCDKKLEQVNPNRPTTGTFWQTKEQAFAGVTAVYSGLITDGTYMRSLPGLTDSRGDDFTGDSPWLDLELTGKFIIPTNSGPVEWIWRDLFIIVNRANQVLAYVGKYPDGVLTADQKSRLLGQAYFLRALAYFNLVNNYKLVPLVTVPPVDPTEYYPATATEDQVWAQIFSDFAAAESMLPLNYSSVEGPDKGHKGRATKGAAAGMLGKAYLYRKDWAKAGAQFEKFISGPYKGLYSLMPDYRDNFKDVNENNIESLFEVQFTATGGTDMNWAGEPSATWRQVTAVSVTYGMEGAGFSDYLPTRWVYNEFKLEKTTGGKSDPRLLSTIASYEPDDNSVSAYGRPWFNPQTKIYPRKYTNDGVGNGKAFETPEGSGINYRILRYADILLMYAEVLNETGKTAEAYPYIQMVRSRASLPDLATAKPNMTQVEMRDQLSHERLLEFSIEGQRIHDLIRWGWFENPTKLAELKTHDADFNSYTPGNQWLPIPQRELDVNKNLSPNPAN